MAWCPAHLHLCVALAAADEDSLPGAGRARLASWWGKMVENPIPLIFTSFRSPEGPMRVPESFRCGGQ